MPRRFQIGDLVERINHAYHGGQNHFELGEQAIITSTHGGLAFETQGSGFSSENFKLIKSVDDLTSTPTGRTIMKYRIEYSQYIGYEDQLSYMPETMGETLMLTKARFKTFLAKTGLKVNYIERYSTGVSSVNLSPSSILAPRVHELFGLRTDIPKYPIKVSSWDGCAKKKHMAILQNILAPVVKRRVHITVPHHEQRSPTTSKSEFKIFVWSSPAYKEQSVPSTMFGQSVGCRDSGYGPSGEGIPLEHDGFVFGELFPNCLYIHFDAVHKDRVQDRIIFAEMMLIVAATLSGTDMTKFEAQRAERVAKAELEAFKSFTRQSIKRVETRHAKELKVLDSEIRRMHKQIFDLERTAAVIRAGGKDGGADAIEKQVLEEFEKLKGGFANIEEAKFSGDELTVVTAPINSVCKRTGNHYHLGRVKIKLPFSNAGSIYMTSVGQNKCIPHAEDRTTGKTCLGTAESDIRSYMANYEMLAAVSMMLAFLEGGIDTEDMWGRKLKEFPNLGRG